MRAQAFSTLPFMVSKLVSGEKKRLKGTTARRRCIETGLTKQKQVKWENWAVKQVTLEDCGPRKQRKGYAGRYQQKELDNKGNHGEMWPTDNAEQEKGEEGEMERNAFSFGST